jgi:hypothetical protein
MDVNDWNGTKMLNNRPLNISRKDWNWLGACLVCSGPAIGQLALPAGRACTYESSETRSVSPAPVSAPGRKCRQVDRALHLSPYSFDVCCFVWWMRVICFVSPVKPVARRIDDSNLYRYIERIWPKYELVSLSEVAMDMWQTSGYLYFSFVIYASYN